MNNIPVITVLTLSYNKGNTIRRTFDSLLQQTSFDFEWLIINDGSTDNTDEIVSTFVTDLFPIRYIKKENEGLNRSFNKGVQLAYGELLFRLDSDDYVKPDAIENILKYKYLIENNNRVAGIVFLSVFENDRLVGSHPFEEKIKLSNFLEYRYKYKAVGDRAEIVKTSIAREIPYPEFKGEKFCPEGLMWSRMAQKYDAFYINQAIYVREYNENCITAAGAKTSINNPDGTSVYLAEILNKIGVNSSTIVMAINYYRYSLRSSFTLCTLVKRVPLSVSAIGLLPGFVLFKLDSLSPSLVSKVKLLFHK